MAWLGVGKGGKDHTRHLVNLSRDFGFYSKSIGGATGGLSTGE